ncbi:MAG: OmpH family outer membrane protein [Woeseiaceae bacterium]
MMATTGITGMRSRDSSSPLVKRFKERKYMKFVKQHLLNVMLAVALLGAFALPAAAQDLKIGVVNLPLLMDRAPQTRAMMTALQEEFAPRQREFEAKQKEYADFAEKVQKDASVMGEVERRNAEKTLRDLQREVARLQTEFQEDANLRQNEELSILQRAILQQVQDYAKAEGYDIVVGDGVLYASTTVNITEEVLRAIEANSTATSAN